MPRPALLLLVLALSPYAFATVEANPVHTTYLWHMHQPIYWPNPSAWDSRTYEFAYETITNGTAQNDVYGIFNSDDRVADYQHYPKDAIASILWTADGGAQVSFAGSLIQNINSLAAAGWNGGRYASNWYQPYRDAHAWTTSGGRKRLDPVLVAFHHSINPLVDEAVFRKMIQAQKSINAGTWNDPALSTGFFPAEMCFSTRLIPVLVEEGITWSVVPDIHIARACADYPAAAQLDNCDPPNPADQINPAQGTYDSQTISRGVTTRVPAPFGFRPHYAQYVNAETGAVDKLIVVPAANGMSWDEGYGLYGVGDINRIAPYNDPAKPMLILFAHDGDNAWSGGHSYYNQNVSQFNNAAVGAGYEPTTVAEYLADHPVDPADVIHVEDGGWVNADGDFGSPQFINWNWPLVNASGQFDIENGWAEDERNWAVLTAAVNHVVTAEQMTAPPVISRVVDPRAQGSTALEKAWHFLLAGHESGYMYYGTSLDMEVKPTLAANAAIGHAAPLLTGTDSTPPTVWIPQRFPWNPGGLGAGALWGYPGGQGAVMTQDFHVWTFVYDVSGVDSVLFRYRVDGDGVNPLASTQNEIFAGGAEVGAWQTLVMTYRDFPAGNVYNNPAINFTVMPTAIADQYWVHLTGFENVLLDYYVEAVDALGNRKKSPIQHVYVGSGGTTGGGGPAVSWTPEQPEAGGTLTISYDPVPGALPDTTDPVYIHIGHSGWTQVLSPDPAMTWSAAESAFVYTYAIPSTATSVDFVFTNGAGAWDNNSGADWHVPVSGGSGPAYVMDGALDPGVPGVGACGGASLYAAYDGTWLYLAAPVAPVAGLDRFFLIADAGSGGTQPAPWGKAGTVASFDRLLGNEASNNWAGWFDGTESGTSSGVSQASGTYLEGLIDVAAVFGSAPAQMRVAFAAYASPNGGTLQAQAPCGNGNGNVEAVEWVTLDAPTLDAPSPTLQPSILRVLSGQPSRGLVRAELAARGGTQARVDVFDVRGRLVATLFDGPLDRARELRWDARAAAPAGVYFLRARGEGIHESRRVVVLP